MGKEKIHWINTGGNGVFQLEIPVITFGNESPELIITGGVHGDEPLGIAIMSKLVNILKNKKLKGKVSLVLAANPAAQFIKKRVSPQDLKDLNRVGSGNKKGYYTDRLAAHLFNIFRKSDFVINIHEFEMHTPITSFFLGQGNNDVKNKIMDGIYAFSPEVIWVPRISNERDAQYKDTLDAALAIEGIPSFIVEAVQLPFITDKEIAEVVKGLLRVMELLCILDVDENVEKQDNRSLLCYRQEFTSDFAGFWEPSSIDLLKSVKKGDLLGIIRRFPDFQKEIVLSPIGGYLLQIRHKELVGTGTSLFSIGIET